MPGPLKRFYKDVSIQRLASPLEGEAEFSASAEKSVGGNSPPRTADAVRPSLKGGVDSFVVLLDGKPAQTPARCDLIVPNKGIADAIAAEWRGQGDMLKPDTMPLTRLANTALDRVRPTRAEAVERAMAFARSDLICYRAVSLLDLVELQNRTWNPLLDWLKQTHGAELKAGAGIAYVEQSPAALAALSRALETQGDFTLAAVSAAASLSGSLVIALALAAEHIDADAAFAASQLDEAHQRAKWGTDAEAAARSARIQAELKSAVRFLRLAGKN